MVLESGIPEIEDIEGIISDFWNETLHAYLGREFVAVHREVINQVLPARYAIQFDVRNLGIAMGQEHEALILYLRDMVIPKISEKIESEVGSLGLGITRVDIWNKVGEVADDVWDKKPWFDSQWARIYDQTTRDISQEYPGKETLRGMVSKIRWELLVGSQDKEKGFFSGLFGDLALVPGAVVTGLAGSFEESTRAVTEAAIGSQEAIWGLFEESQKLLGEAVTGVFGDFFQVGGPLLGILGSIPMTILKVMMGAQDETAGILLDTLKMSSPENVTKLQKWLASVDEDKGYWKPLTEIDKTSPDIAFAVAQRMKNDIHTGVISTRIAAALFETFLPYETGVAHLVPELFDTLYGRRSVLQAWEMPIMQAALQTPMEQWANKRWQPSIPGPADMVAQYVKEGYELVRQKHIPDGFVADMELHGFAEKWTKLYWGAHWILPPVQLLYEFYHRFPLKFPKEQLKKYLKWHDFHPEEHEWFIEAAETLIPRIDLRRALDYGQLEFEDLAPRYMQLGYSEENAGIMANIARRFSLGAERSDLRKIYERRFMLGFITEEEFQAALKELEFGSLVIEERTKYIKLRKETDEEVQASKIPEEIRIKELTVSQLGRALKYGRITEIEYNTRLGEYGYSEADIRVLRERILEDPVVDTQESIEREILRTKTRTYRSLYAREAIDRSKLLTNLLAIGVAEELAMAIADFEDAKKVEIPEEEKVAEETALERRVRQMHGSTAREQYKRWQIDLDDLTDALQGYGYDVDEARAIAGYEEIRRPPAPVPAELVEDEERRLEVQRLEGQSARERFRDRVIDRSTLETELLAIGYHTEVARAIASLEEARLPVPAMTEEEKDMARSEARAKRLRETALRNMYRGWVLTETDLRECLLAIPLDPSVVQGIIDLENTRRPEEPIPPEEKERLKHVAEVRMWESRVVREAYRKAKVTREELYRGLVEAGYPDDIAWLIREYEVYHRLAKPK